MNLPAAKHKHNKELQRPQVSTLLTLQRINSVRTISIYIRTEYAGRMPSTDQGTATPAVIPLLINNESIVTDKTFPVHNPSTNTLISQCVSATVDDAHRAAAAASAAFPAWSKLRPYTRRDILMKGADVMLSRKEELITYQREETGAGRPFAEHTFMLGVNLLKDFAARIPSIEGTVPALTQDGEGAVVYKEPYGVVLGIAPWYVSISFPMSG